MTIYTLRFGEVDVDESKILSFAAGLPGLEEYTRFAALRFEESYPIFWLQAIDDARVCLPVIDSFLALPDYAFELEDSDASELDLTSAEDLSVMSVIVIPEKIEGMTANLAAPIVINTRTGNGKQIILQGTDYNARFPIFIEVARIIKEVGGDAGSVAEN